MKWSEVENTVPEIELGIFAWLELYIVSATRFGAVKKLDNNWKIGKIPVVHFVSI